MKSQIKDEIESQHVSAEEAMTDVTTNFANVLGHDRQQVHAERALTLKTRCGR